MPIRVPVEYDVSGKNLERQLNSDLDKAGKSGGKRFGSGIVAGFRGIAGPLAAVGAAVGVKNFLGGALEEAREAQKVGALTAQVIKTTGGAANVTTSQVETLAGSISNLVGVDDEAIQSGANLLLTFKNVRNEVGRGNDVFNRATKAAVDLSAAGFGDINGASKQLGKALNDPLKGLTALGRSGVTFTKQQQELIKSLVAGGDILGAQRIILREVETQVGGAAEAQATAADKARVAWGNLQEQFGISVVAPLVDVLANLAARVLPKVTSAVAKVGPLFSWLSDALSGRGGAGGAAARLGETFTKNVLPVLRQVGQYLVSTVLPVFRQWGKVLVTNVLPAVGSVARFLFTQLLPAIVGVWRNVGENLRPVFEAVVDVLKRDVIPTVVSLVKTFQSNEPAIQNVVLAVTGLIGKVYGLASAVLGALLPPIIRFAGFLIRTVVPAVARVIGVVVQLVAGVVRAGQAVGRFVSKVASGVADVARFIGGLPGRIVRIAGDFLDAGVTLGRNVIDGIGRGLRAAGGFISDLATSIKNAINDALRLPFTIKGPGPLPDFTIPAFAGGTRFAPGGLALVGERGPELVNLPRGSRVRTAAQTRDALGGGVGGGVVNVVQNNYGPSTGRERLRELEWTMKYATRARGVEAGVA